MKTANEILFEHGIDTMRMNDDFNTQLFHAMERYAEQSPSKEQSIIKDTYWEERCLAAENFIDKSDCDPDITTAQIKAYSKWQSLKEKATQLLNKDNSEDPNIKLIREMGKEILEQQTKIAKLEANEIQNTNG